MNYYGIVQMLLLVLIQCDMLTANVYSLNYAFIDMWKYWLYYFL